MDINTQIASLKIAMLDNQTKLNSVSKDVGSAKEPVKTAMKKLIDQMRLKDETRYW